MNEQTNFFNTAGEEGERLEKFEKKAAAQNIVVLKIFQENPNLKMTRAMVEGLTQYKYRYSSITRAIRCLTRDGKITKLGKEERIKGPEGKIVHRWILATKD